jgi:aspartyl protease family protein
MSPRYLIFLFAAAVLAGWFIPARQSPDTAPAPELAQTDLLQADDEGTLAEPEQANAVILARQPDGHFYTQANVNGGDVRFLVDTGASGIALTGADADALGIVWDDSDLEMVGRGASGDVYGKQVMLKSIQIGGVMVRDLPAAVIPEGLDVSLLGQSFLSKVGSVNIRENQMTFE